MGDISSPNSAHSSLIDLLNASPSRFIQSPKNTYEDAADFSKSYTTSSERSTANDVGGLLSNANAQISPVPLAESTPLPSQSLAQHQIAAGSITQPVIPAVCLGSDPSQTIESTPLPSQCLAQHQMVAGSITQPIPAVCLGSDPSQTIDRHQTAPSVPTPSIGNDPSQSTALSGATAGTPSLGETQSSVGTPSTVTTNSPAESHNIDINSNPNTDLNTDPAQVSRSGRTLKPTNYIEKLNQIGASSKRPTAEKENIPLTDAVGQVPEWALSAREFLTKTDLGPEWANCVDAWWKLESVLNFGGPKGKVCNRHQYWAGSDNTQGGTLPGSSRRPEEWTKWTQKSRGGQRPYSQSPAIPSAMEFGLAVMAWWHDLQPSFRKSDDPFPLNIFLPFADKASANHWAPLRKAGPNGLVSVITTLAWWGQAALVPHPFEDDSKPNWLRIIADVQCAIEKMMSAGAKRRADSNSEPSTSSKK